MTSYFYVSDAPSYRLVWQIDLLDPVMSLEAFDLTGDQVEEVCVRTSKCLVIYKQDKAKVKSIQVERLNKLCQIFS